MVDSRAGGIFTPGPCVSVYAISHLPSNRTLPGVCSKSSYPRQRSPRNTGGWRPPNLTSDQEAENGPNLDLLSEFEMRKIGGACLKYSIPPKSRGKGFLIFKEPLTGPAEHPRPAPRPDHRRHSSSVMIFSRPFRSRQTSIRGRERSFAMDFPNSPSVMTVSSFCVPLGHTAE